MRAIELTGYVDENHQLCVDIPADVAPGPVKVILEVEEEDPAAWGRAVLQRWAEESEDPDRPRAALVWGSRRPVAGRPLLLWNCRSADAVFRPMTPSIEPTL